MLKLISIFSMILLSVPVYSQLPNHNMYVVGNLHLHPVPPQFGAPWDYSALWGYTAPDGREYVILGAALGTSFVDITDSANINEVNFFPAPSTDFGNLWREMKSYSHYAYVVSEALGSGVEIYNLQYLPDSVVFVQRFIPQGHLSTHTISQEGPYLYLNGCNTGFGRGTVVLDLTSDPENPVVRGKWNERYVHDCRVVDDTIYAMNINSSDGTISVIDATNKDMLTTVTSWLNLPNPSPHNCDLTKDKKYLFATDETGSLPRLLKVWNIEDLTNPILETTWQPTGITTSRVHNVEIYGDTAVIAHYTAGVRVLDISNPTQPVEIAWYDTYPQSNNADYLGVWAVYKFPSGKIAASDMTTGLYILKMGESVSIKNISSTVPDGYSVSQNFPNPFNPVTKIIFSIPEKGLTKLAIFDVTGRIINVAVNQVLNIGSYEYTFDAGNLPSGVYYYKLSTENFSSVKKMTLIK